MTLFEKITIPICLISYTIGISIAQLENGATTVSMGFAYLVLASFFGLCIYYLVRTKRSVYTIVFCLLALIPIHWHFSLLHWPVIFPLEIIQLFTPLLVAALLIRSSIMKFKEWRSRVIYPLVAAGVLIGQLIISWPWLYQDYSNLRDYLHYLFLVAFLAMLAQNIFRNRGERWMLTIMALQAAIFVIGDVLSLFI